MDVNDSEERRRHGPVSGLGHSDTKYLVFPRHVLMSMPLGWQQLFVRLLACVPVRLEVAPDPVVEYEVLSDVDDGYAEPSEPLLALRPDTRRLDS